MQTPELDGALENFFAADGQMALSDPDFVPRAGQVQLAQAIGRALLDGRVLLAEAGCGTGKTLAYLAPALISGKKVIVSTSTRQLQEQIVHHDLPKIAKALKRTIDAVEMKGRDNYLCILRFEASMQQASLYAALSPTRKAIAQWHQKTDTGDRAELTQLGESIDVWPELSATSAQCVGRTCPFWESCYVVGMRRKAQRADIVIVNHHLFFADAALKMRGPALSSSQADAAFNLIPESDAIIFDEAHELDEVAGSHFGEQIDLAEVHKLVEELEHFNTNQATDLNATVSLKQIYHDFVSMFARMTTFGRTRLYDDALLEALQDDALVIDSRLMVLEAELNQARAASAPSLLQMVLRLGRALRMVVALPERHSVAQGHDPIAIDGEADINSPQWVRYADISVKNKTLAARPVDVAPLLRYSIAHHSCTFISATLRTDDDFLHVKARFGLDDADEITIDSPFNFMAQAALYTPAPSIEMTAIDVADPSYNAEAAKIALRLVDASGGGALILCTSHAALKSMRQAMRCHTGPVLMQGDGPKEHLLAQMRARNDVTLLATMGFWRGVDVPGPSLRLVIMDKIPFASPADPLLQARLERMAQQGLDGFRHHQLPQALLLLKQGFGRLIRSTEDRGVVAILDPRLQSRRYGPIMLRGLPRCAHLESLADTQAILRAQNPRGARAAKTQQPPARVRNSSPGAAEGHHARVTGS